MARNPLWDFVTERDGLGLSVDTGAIAAALLGGIVGAFTDVAVGGARVIFAVISSPFQFVTDVAVVGIDLLASLLPAVLWQGALETASSLGQFGQLAFPIAILVGVAGVAWILAKSTDLGGSFFG